MDKAVNDFINKTIINLEAIRDIQDVKLVWAVLKNLSTVIESYVEVLEDELELV